MISFRSFLGIAIALLAALIGKAQEVKQYDVNNFTGIKSYIAANVEISQSSTYKVEITSDNIPYLNNIEVTVDSKGILCINCKQEVKINYESEEIIVRISAPSINTIEHNGVGNIITLYAINLNKLEIELCGVGDVRFPKGGKVKYIDIECSGIGNIDTHRVKCTDGEVVLSGVGNAQVFATNSLIGDISGIGNLTIYGDALIDIQKNGFGRIIRK